MNDKFEGKCLCGKPISEETRKHLSDQMRYIQAWHKANKPSQEEFFAFLEFIKDENNSPGEPNQYQPNLP